MEKKRVPIYETSDFRYYEPEQAVDGNGNVVMMYLCESLENGRWEPFYYTHGPTKATKRADGEVSQ